MRKNPFIKRRRSMDDWNFMTRPHIGHLHKDTDEDAFDKVPKIEGMGAPLNDYSYTTPALTRWFIRHLGQPVAIIQKKLKAALPNTTDYANALGKIWMIRNVDGVDVLYSKHRFGVWFASVDIPVSEGRPYTDVFYEDYNGILRILPRKKFIPRKKSVALVHSADGYTIYKRKGITYIAKTSSAVIDRYAERSSNIRYQSSYREVGYYSFGCLRFFRNEKVMVIDSKNIRQANKKDLEGYSDLIKLITEDVIEGTP